MSHTPHLLSPPPQLKRVPSHMLDWLAADLGDLDPRTEHPLRCRKCLIRSFTCQEQFQPSLRLHNYILYKYY